MNRQGTLTPSAIDRNQYQFGNYRATVPAIQTLTNNTPPK